MWEGLAVIEYTLSLQVKTACVSDAASAVATPPPVDQALFHAVQCLPRTGPVKARQLLDAFHSQSQSSMHAVHVAGEYCLITLLVILQV